mmetsp:Transcript_61273/g.172775  ORF Transcript_61273/g.172775 Transcript_61273/m.172775 type:complete len:295 (-) Transcript_61273:295-1179(-)
MDVHGRPGHAREGVQQVGADRRERHRAVRHPLLRVDPRRDGRHDTREDGQHPAGQVQDHRERPHIDTRVDGEDDPHHRGALQGERERGRGPRRRARPRRQGGHGVRAGDAAAGPAAARDQGRLQVWLPGAHARPHPRQRAHGQGDHHPRELGQRERGRRKHPEDAAVPAEPVRLHERPHPRRSAGHRQRAAHEGGGRREGGDARVPRHDRAAHADVSAAAWAREGVRRVVRIRRRRILHEGVAGTVGLEVRGSVGTVPRRCPDRRALHGRRPHAATPGGPRDQPGRQDHCHRRG